MWFDDDDISGRRLFSRKRNRRRTPVLSVRARGKTKKKVNSHRAGAFILVPAVVVAASVLLFLGVRSLGRALFSENDLFEIRSVEVRASSEAVRERTKRYTRIAEGMNIFGFEIGQVRDTVLKKTHSYKDITISRQLPGKVLIDVVERVPLARLGRKGVLVVDREGCVFALGSRARDLPGLLGYAGEGIAPGDRVIGMAAAALQVLEVCDDPRLDLGISAVRVDDDEKLVLQLTHDGRRREVDVAWSGMGVQTSESRRSLIRRVIEIKRTLESREARNRTVFDATFPNGIYAE